MADFTSNFWGIFVLVTTVLSIVALFLLIAKFKGGKKITPGEDHATTGHVWDEDLHEYNNPLPGWWLNMFYITLVFGVIYLILYPGLGSFGGIKGWSQVKQYEEELQHASEKYDPIFDKYLKQDLVAVASNPEAVEIGRRLFSTYCTTCHGSDAGGAPGFPNLRDDDWLFGGEPQTIKQTIMKGRFGKMPAWKGVLSDSDISNVVQYIVSLSGQSADASAVTAGQQVFMKNCAVCHGPDAKGNKMLGAPNLSDDIWLYGGSMKRIMESVASGRMENAMPAHEGFLGEARVHLLAAYVYSLSQNK